MFILFASPFAGAFDLSQTETEKLANGLTVLVLEDHTLPLVSTQMLYKAGARNECVGSTGVAHFVEHMAFRATKNFPDTDVVSRIYAAGGEWHGYTWIDETTYFETVPREHLDLTLRIQADRMQNALINESELDAERGAVITELHSYENDPATILSDAVLTETFLQHPYRYNTIGWTSDVERITHSDVVNFYRRYYNPSNAVLAIVGDVQFKDALEMVHKYFDAIPAGDADTMPRTIEPPQAGERRIQIQGSGSIGYFQITYRAPSARDPDFPAFVLLQAILNGSPGVNFNQSEEPEEAASGTRLYGVADHIGTFLAPTADPYVFSITGRSSTPGTTEAAIEQKITDLRDREVPAAEIETARKQLLFELAFDVQSTEDAAHQLAFFEGIGARETLLRLPDMLQAVTPADVKRVAQRFLQPHQRTIGWYMGGTALPAAAGPASVMISPVAASSEKSNPAEFGPLEIRKMKNGITLIAQRTDHTPTAFLRILVPSNTVEADGEFTPDEPVWRYTSVNWRFLRENFGNVLAEASRQFESRLTRMEQDPADIDDPETRLNQLLPELLGVKTTEGNDRPVVISVVGDLEDAANKIEASLGALKSGKRPDPIRLGVIEKEKTIRIPGKAQSQLGYAVPAPAPSEKDSWAYRILLYIMTHAYEGRLGKDMIARRGLIYYIGSAYNSDGNASWISMTIGVDPDKLAATREQFHALMADLQEHPPTVEEIEEAKTHLIGRRLTGAQSNEELSALYVRDWIEQGKVMSKSEVETAVRAVTLEQVRKIVPVFLAGVTAIVDTGR